MAAVDERGREKGVSSLPLSGNIYFTGKKLNNFRLEGLL
jgi:hypothetical protein